MGLGDPPQRNLPSDVTSSLLHSALPLKKFNDPLIHTYDHGSEVSLNVFLTFFLLMKSHSLPKENDLKETAVAILFLFFYYNLCNLYFD